MYSNFLYILVKVLCGYLENLNMFGGLIKIPDLGFIVDLVNLQKKLSIRVPLFWETLVGSVMWA